MSEKFQYKYCPILAISPSELVAFKELPVKDKKQILPVFPLKSWATATTFEKALDKVKESVGKENLWIADIALDDLEARPKEKWREVHHELFELADPANGYRNWCQFIASERCIIPCLQTRVRKEIPEQIEALNALDNGVVLLIDSEDVQEELVQDIATALTTINDLLIILDLGQVDRQQLSYSEQLKSLLLSIKRLVPNAILALSSTSFPSKFGGFHKSTNTIYERAIFDKVRLDIKDLIYSDRGSSRAEKQSGANGTPPPRIDYACKNEWHFIRREFSKSLDDLTPEQKKAALKKEKKELYTKISQEMKLEQYWEDDLALYSNYLIDLTSQGNAFGIDSAQKATAVRINKHLFTQLHYDDDYDATDTDDDWEDL